MAKTYTEEQLNTFDKATLVQLLLMQQSQLQEIDKKLQLLLEQTAVLKNNRFGKKSEKWGLRIRSASWKSMATSFSLMRQKQ